MKRIPPSLARRFEDIRLAGEGAVGTVYRAVDPRLGRPIALKLLESSEPSQCRRLIAEARAQARIQHEHVCGVFEAGLADGEPYIVMQYIDGAPLSRVRERMTLEQQVKLLQEVATAMHEAHRQGLIHRDSSRGTSSSSSARTARGSYTSWTSVWRVRSPSGDTESCRHVLRSAVECALTPDQSVVDPVTGELYTGWWGLAPSWSSNVLETQGRRYVTACMVQRLNYYGASVPILLEGPSSPIARNASFDARYVLEESTVFGDLFSSTTPLLGLLPAFNVYVCWESLLPQSCGLLGLPLLEKRICDDVPLCGLVTLGPCALSCVEDGPYWKCQPGPHDSWWTETVRVKLEMATCQ